MICLKKLHLSRFERKRLRRHHTWQ